MTMKRRILITGGSGFIGTNLINYLCDQGETVLNIDLSPPLNNDDRSFYKEVNLLDLKRLQVVVTEFAPTHIVHLAARTDLNGKHLSDYEVNTVGTHNLIAAANQCHHLQKIIFTSSMLVCKPGYIPKNDFDFLPGTIYGESKKNMELLVRAATINAEWIIVRPTSIWGPWFKTPYRDYFDRIMRGTMYNIKGRACIKTYGFVLNTVYQINQLLNTKGIAGQVFYLGDQPPINITEWTNQICDAIQEKRPKEIPYPLFVLAGKLGDLLNSVGIQFPMTSFRLKNMTTNNILPLHNLYELTGPMPYSENDAIQLTLDWIKNSK
jgi:GlcNAc-P-P-Und epimerase